MRKVDEFIQFDQGVSCDFFSHIIRTSIKKLKVDKDKSQSIEEMEALRRAAALIEAILTEKLEIN